MNSRSIRTEEEIEELAESGGFPIGARIRDNDGLNYLVGVYKGDVLAYRVLTRDDAPDLETPDVRDFIDLRLPITITTENQ